MKAAVYKEKGLLQVEDLPMPEMGPRDLLVKVHCCAICGSDIHRYAHGMLRPGMVMGHEYSGTVVEKGSEVTDFEVGDRITRCDAKMSPAKSVPNPARFSARQLGLGKSLRNQAYAEYMSVDMDRIMKIPDEVSNIEACSTEPIAFTLHSVRISQMKLGDKVLLLGAGPIGLFTMQLALLAGASDVYVSEVNPARMKMAAELGATKVINPLERDIVAEIVRQTDIGVDVAFECAGAKPTLQQALESVCIRGRVIFQSLAWQPIDCIPVDWAGREVELKTAYGTFPRDWTIAGELMARKRIKIKPIISRVIGIDDMQPTFQELLRPETDLVQVVLSFE